MDLGPPRVGLLRRLAPSARSVGVIRRRAPSASLFGVLRRRAPPGHSVGLFASGWCTDYGAADALLCACQAGEGRRVSEQVETILREFGHPQPTDQVGSRRRQPAFVGAADAADPIREASGPLCNGCAYPIVAM